jgi:hypothetical protein
LVCHRALVNMHLRFDGKLGFPGGLVETEEDVETGKYCTLIKNKIKFSSSGAKSYMTDDLLIYGENICAFSHILGSPSSYMTLHPSDPIPSEYEENFVFIFISVPCQLLALFS